jgi:hypothetical protein
MHMTLSDHHRVHEAAAAAVWAAECYKPERERQYRSPYEIANALARRPGRLEVDSAERKRILHDLADWVRRGKFDASDVVILSGGDSPDFVSLTPLLPSEILVTGDDALIRRPGGSALGPFGIVHLATTSEALFLRRRAVRQYIENSELEGAARVKKEWFSEAAAPSDEAAAISNRRGPRGELKAAAIAAMMRAVQSGDIDISQLKNMYQKNLVNLFPNGKRTMLAEACDQAIKNLRQNPDKTPTNDK